MRSSTRPRRGADRDRLQRGVRVVARAPERERCTGVPTGSERLTERQAEFDD
jgi:hypothetical protein